ncbi:hypothetical protein VTJ04DRAFT_4386 [Mycothermus thermophilus]|uniref:uncharacterized protein n=1 Tax=Humicola insolens TaxID=85995 RepID=UPI0037440CE3
MEPSHAVIIHAYDPQVKHEDSQSVVLSTAKHKANSPSPAIFVSCFWPNTTVARATRRASIYHLGRATCKSQHHSDHAMLNPNPITTSSQIRDRRC